MADNSKISWTDSTHNEWIGCTKVSQGCANCYAESLMDHRFGTVEWGPQGTRKLTKENNRGKPRRWNDEPWAECLGCGRRGPEAEVSQGCVDCNGAEEVDQRPTMRRVFAQSLADTFEDRPELVSWRCDLLMRAADCSNMIWLLLTKRPENVMRMLEQAFGTGGRSYFDRYRHVWIGTSVEDQFTADQRLPHLLEIPGARRFISYEPLLGPVDVCYLLPRQRHVAGGGKEWINLDGIHWGIVGGESGPNARPMHSDWVRSLRDQHAQAGVPFHFKQWGEWGLAGDMYDTEHCVLVDRRTGATSPVGRGWGNRDVAMDLEVVRKFGKHQTGNLLEGVAHLEFPEFEQMAGWTGHKTRT